MTLSCRSVISSSSEVTDESLICRGDEGEAERSNLIGGHRGEFLCDRQSDHRPYVYQGRGTLLTLLLRRKIPLHGILVAIITERV